MPMRFLDFLYYLGNITADNRDHEVLGLSNTVIVVQIQFDVWIRVSVL
jgi:hypothetical protein